jgi:hypothetical protein
VVNVEATAGPLAVNLAASGNPTVNVSPAARNLGNIAGTLSVNGAGFGTLNLDDQTNPTGVNVPLESYTYALSPATLSRTWQGVMDVNGTLQLITQSATVNYGGLAALTLNGGGGGYGGSYGVSGTAGGTATTLNTANSADMVNVEATAGPLTVNLAASGNPTVNLSPTAHLLDNLHGGVTVNGSGFGTVNVNDQASTAANQYTLTSTTLTRPGFGGLTYHRIASLTVNAETGQNQQSPQVILIQSTAAGVATTINATAGYHDVAAGAVGGSTNSLSALRGPLTVNGPSTVNLSLYDTTASAGRTYTAGTSTTVGDSTISATADAAGVVPALVTYSGTLDAVVVYGTPFNDTADVASLPTGSSLVFDLMNGHNTAESTLPGISTWLIYPSAAGVSSVSLDGRVVFGQAWNLIGGPGNDYFQFTPQYRANGSIGGTIDGGGGINTLDYSQYAAADHVTGVSVQLANAPALGTATGVGIGTGTTPTPAVSNIQNLVGSRYNDVLIGNDQDNVIQPWGGRDVVRGMGGNDTVRLTGLQDPASTLDGGTGTNLLWAPDGVNVWTLTGPAAGSFVSTANTNANPLAFTNFQQLLGGLGADTFRFVPASGVTLTNWFSYLNGNLGTNWLDYSAYNGAVTVNLATYTATGVAGANALFIQNVIGSATAANTLTGNNDPLGNILVGGSAADTITGGNTRSILIGGQGNDVVTGGTGDDIVIGGTTAYDHNQAALQAILNEWLNTNDSYLTRIGKIRAGIGSGGNTYSLVWGTTVFDDSGPNGLGHDTLRGDPPGSAVRGMDWFFANQGPGGVLDTILDLQAGEKVNNQP